jgi:hypothetical protein
MSNISNEEEKQSLWNALKEGVHTCLRWLLRYPLAFILTLAVVVGASVLMVFGLGNRFNVGGIIGKLFGSTSKPSRSRIEIANSVPEGRVDSGGNNIPKGEVDAEGFVQREVEVLVQPSNPFRDKSKIIINDPEEGEKVLTLPTGVIDSDVDKIMVVKPEVYHVEVKSRPATVVTREHLDWFKRN